MLNPPLSLLSDDLFLYIVNHVAELPSPNKHLCNLSLTDRAFTHFCQSHMLKVLYLGGNLFHPGGNYKDSMSSRLERMGNILDEKPSFANRVREVNILISYRYNSWFFNDRTFISIFQLLAKSLMPPHKLHLSGLIYPFVFEDPILIVGRLMQTFFSQTLTVLHLTHCENVPLTLFFICPRLREVLLDEAKASENYDKYPDGQYPRQELPKLDSLDYRNSESLVEQMMTPPPMFRRAATLLSKLRVLKLSPREERTTCLQPILDITCNTLEELYLFTEEMWQRKIDHFPFAGLVNLRNLSCLRVLALCTVIKCDAPKSAVRDINLVLSTIPTFNKVTSLTFKLDIWGNRPFLGCLEEDWVGLCDEVIRISGGRHLKLTLEVVASELRNFGPSLQAVELCERINEKMTCLSEYPNIRTRFMMRTKW